MTDHLPQPHTPPRPSVLRRLMKRKAVTIPAGIVLAIILLDAGSQLITRKTLAAGPLDTAAVERIAVTGAASRITITADPSKPFEARLTGERSGWGAAWRSAWFAHDCTPGAALAIKAGTLEVDTGRVPYDFGLDDCTLTLSANVRPQAAVMIDQKAAAITLAGNFSSLDIRSDAGDVRVDGHADLVSLSGAALRARIVFDRVRNTETIRLIGAMMEAGLTFPPGTAIAYLVEATASYIDSKLPNTPGAKPSVEIRGDMVHATIR
ncbi:hypothetical protein SAMN05880582_10338 [Rhizobium sp. RU20A]|uniref:hypothetical protein n=1 Tax=Rhizobium sp. RU20A TaxID=1907412 RepID=UPI00095641EC|nr:hypothetical protein [Rhizobium sp. RU20A]SIQ69113.1 hypothetical protein SAMN05880582_10338 [Rhizobium sp. RU20A]